MSILKLLTCFTTLFCLLSGCGKVNPAVSERQAKASPTPVTCSKADLRQRIEGIASATGGPVGVAVALVGSDEGVSVNGQKHFPMQSVYKLPIGMAILHQIDQGKLKLDQKVVVKPTEYVGSGQVSPLRDRNPRGVEITINELLTYAVSISDGTASDVLMRVAGGAGTVMSYLRGLGIDGVMVVDTEMEIGRDSQVQYRNWATPESAIALLRIVADGRSFSPASHELLIKLMTETQTGPNRIKGMLPPGTVVAHKTGSSGTSGGLTRATNDIGLVTLPDGKQMAVAVFVSDTKVGRDAAESVIAKITRASWDCWIKQ
jgi:beta-lactamase class A